MKLEPKIHSDISNSDDYSRETIPLPGEHPLFNEKIYCKTCVLQVYDGTYHDNDATWVETGAGNYCLKCFYEYVNEKNVEDCGQKCVNNFGLDLSRYGFGLDNKRDL